MTGDAPGSGPTGPPCGDGDEPGTGPGQLLARFDRPAPAEPSRLGVITDLHLSPEETGTWKDFEATVRRLEVAVERLNDRPLDGVLFGGDLTKDGTPAEFEAVDDRLADLAHELYAIPGNHDLETTFDDEDSLGLEGFASRYTPDGYPFRWSVGGLDVLALNSHQTTREGPADTWEGGVDEATLEWLADQLEAADAPLVAIHHALDGAFDLYGALRERLPVHGGSPGFPDAGRLIDVLVEHEVPLTLTGHLHFPAVVPYGDGSVRELTLPALGSFPGALLEIEADETGTRVWYDPVTTVEERTDALTHGHEKDRVLITAVQLADLPLHDDAC